MNEINKSKIIAGALVMLFAMTAVIGCREEIFLNKKQTYGVSCNEPIAAQVGLEVLQNGGNAVDAAVAVSYALAVLEPYASGLGGGGGMLVYDPKENKVVFYDYLETATASGKMTTGQVGVPGLVKGMEAVQKDYGKLQMKTLIDPSVKLARDGFKARSYMNEWIRASVSKLDKNSLKEFFPDGQPIKEGETLVQSDLADTLERIKESGSDEFYKGATAKKIASAVPEITLEDLSGYTVRKSEAVKGQYNGYVVYSAPPPFAGVTLIQSLQMAEKMGLYQKSVSEVEFMDAMSKIKQATYSDRVKNIGDKAYTTGELANLTSKEYTDSLATKIGAGITGDENSSGTETTHFVVVDKDGMMVSVTNSLSDYFGSGIVAGGVFLNNHLSNFSKSSNSVNRIEPNKRPRTFMAPAIFVKEGQSALAIGSPGGNAIPMMVTEVFLKLSREGSTIGKDSLNVATNSNRFFPDGNKIYYEGNLDSGVKDGLRNKGYQLVPFESNAFYGGVNSIYIDYVSKHIYGGADKRKGASFKAD